ncbi:hypothetical protein [Anaeromyxobacter oryzisoli]|uniref:hypothetical protein n=1 Tax=Anaeromyxobacter oryzisoli TaxID=2925408 RepID=UPI001F567B63|nr:hypothetical protein [Anaeromyxobacter sp. SG63]
MTRSPRLLAAALLAAALGAAGPAVAQDRPSEEELFGPAPPPAQPAAPSAPAPAGEQAPPGPPAPSDAREAEMFGSSGSPNAVPPPPERIVERARAQENPLVIGGQLYLRALATAQQGVPASQWFFSSPNLLDVYLDARPNDRVRGFALERVSYDPTLVADTSTLGQPVIPVPGVSATPRQNPRGVLDQLWVNFDLGRRVFVTAGKQHVKWGVGKFWNPTDYLHPVKRDPLAVFDPRAGATMVKVHVPWEKRGWNLYGVALLEDVAGQPQAVDRVGRVASGGRAEVVFGLAELGVDALVQDGRRPRFGADVSAGVWDLDLYAEAALRTGVDGSRWVAGPSSAADVFGYVRRDPEGFVPQVTVGGTWSWKYSDEDAATFGAEYFYNDAGYDGPAVYPFLLAGAPLVDVTDPAAPKVSQRAPGAFTPYYLGRHYAGAYASLPSPGSWNDHTFTLSVLGNLSDRSFIARLDHAVLALTYLRVESFVAGHLGRRGGEFRFAFDLPPGAAQALGVAPDPRLGKAPVIDLGVALRVSL